jgi:MYXO-CTERM domain-containing protein
VDVVEAAMLLREQPWVRWAQADWIQPRSLRYVPDDSFYEDQWHLDNTGQSGGGAGNDVNAPEAWDQGRGDPSVIVAILDSGVELDHPDLEEDLLPGYDFVDNDDDPSPNGSHGTMVAGVAASAENGIGGVGACPGCSILPVRVIGAGDSGEADAHIFAADHGAWVINNSWGPPDGTGSAVPMSPAMETAVAYALESGRGGKGTAIFWAAGNGHPTDTCSDDGFAAHPDVIAVGASTDGGVRPGYSEICPELDISAPSNGGSAGLTTTRTGGGYTSGFGGTSAASPLAAGVGALVLSLLPDLTAAQLQSLLEQTAQRIDEGGGEWDQGGHSIHYGWGRVDAAAALQSELAFLTVLTSLTTCDADIDVKLSLPGGEGQGEAVVTAWSSAETAPETFILSEAEDGVYRGSISLTAEAPEPGDGLVSVDDGDSLQVSSEDSGTTQTVSLDCVGPEITSIVVDEVTSSGARVRWFTDELGDSTVEFGEGRTAHDPELSETHSIYLLDLAPCEAYRVDIESADALGNVGREANAHTFTTLGDRTLIPASAPEGADPCDESTWSDAPPEPTPGLQQTLTSGNGTACDGCSTAHGGPAAPWVLSALALFAGRRRRRPSRLK